MYASSRLSLTNCTIHDGLGWGVSVYGNVTLTNTGNTFANNASGDVGP